MKPMSYQIATPVLLRLCFAVIAVGTIAISLIVFGKVSSGQQVLSVLADQAQPSIVSSQHIKGAVSDLDASIAAELTGHMPAVEIANKRRHETVRNIVEAARHMHDPEVERPLLTDLENALLQYEGLVTKARMFKGLDQQAQCLTTYAQATELMHGSIFKLADQLEKSAFEFFEHVAAEHETAFPWRGTLLLLCGLASCSALSILHVGLRKRTHRTFNLPLLLSSVVLVALLMMSSNAGSTNSNRLSSARSSCDTLRGLWKTRATVHDIKGDERRMLLYSGDAAKIDQGVGRKVANITGLGIKESPSERANLTVLSQQNGYLSTVEISSQSQDKIRTTLSRYLKSYSLVHASVSKADMEQATRLALHDEKGGSVQSFDDLDQALGEAIHYSDLDFDRLVKEARSSLTWLWMMNLISLLVVLPVTYLGINPRLREYQLGS